jgi:hypothetical protein
MRKEFRENFVGLLTLVVVALIIYGLVKLGTRATAASVSNIAPAQSDDLGAADQHLHAAVFTTTGGQTSTLGLNNALNHPMTAQVTLYNKHGQSLTIPPVTLGPHQNHGWNVADWVRNVGGFEEGSLEVFYHGPSMALGAQETVTDANHSLSYDVHLQEPMDFMSPRADGLWWALDDNQTEARVFIANTSATQTAVTPTFYLGGTAYQGDAITLSAHESDSIDIDKSLKKLHLSTPAVGGISLNYTNGPGTLAVVGVISNKYTGFSTTMRFIDQEGQHTTSLHGASILIGKPAANLGFSATTRFTPHVFVRNNTNQPVQIHPRIRYTLFDQPNTVSLVAVTLSPNAVRELDLSPAINAIGTNPITDTGIEIDHAGQPGAAMAYAASVDQSGSNVIDVPIKDPKSEMAFKGGSYPWNIAGDNRAVLHIKSVDVPNDGLKRQAMAKLYFDGGEYNLPLQQMEAGQTVEVDLKKLRDDQVKDVLGNVIPLTVTGGQLDWSGRANKGEFIGRLIEYNPVGGVASSFSCVQPCICDPSFAGGFLYPFSISGKVGDYVQIHAIETDLDCNNFPYTFQVDNANFFTTNPFVVLTFGNTAILVGGGNATVFAEWDSYFVTTHCFYTAEGDCNDGFCIFSPVTATGDTQVGVRPTVSSISPNKGLIGQPINVTITGTGFVTGSTVNIDSGSVQNVTIQSSTTITANYTSNDNASGGNHRVTVTNGGGPSTDNVNFYVQIPTSLQVLSITTIPSSPVFSWSQCFAGQDFGIQVAIQYQVLDQEQPGQVISSSGMEPEEVFTNIVQNGNSLPDRSGDVGPSGYPGSTQFTDANGRFIDAPYGGCSSTNVTFSFTQTLHIVPLNQNNYVVRVNDVSISSTSSGSGTISNGGDIVKSRP